MDTLYIFGDKENESDLDGVLLSKKTLGDLEFTELHKAEVSERHWDVNISHSPKCFKMILQKNDHALYKF